MCRFRMLGMALFVTGMVALCGGQGAHGEDGTLLRWKFRVGEKSEMVMTQEMRMKMQVKEKAIEATTTTIMDLALTTTAVDPQGAATIEQTIERARMKMGGIAGLGMDYDSASDKKPEGLAANVAPAFEAITGKPFIVTVNSLGKAVEVKLPEGLKESVSKMPGGAQLSGMFSEEGVKNMTQMATLPEKPVSPGDTWGRKTKMKNPVLGDMTVETTSRYLGFEIRDGKKLEKIALEIKMQFGEGKDAKAKIVDQDSQGTIYFDNQQGQLVESTSDSKMTLRMSIQGQEFEQVVETKVAYVRKGKESALDKIE
jgi:hypothetical protein